MTIYLVGSMGVGKSAIGRAVAQKLNLPLIDTDHEIVADAGISINQIFSDYGEPYFRQLESKKLREFNSTKSQIISTGGGLPMTHDNMEYMLHNGVVVYLKANIEDIVERLLMGKHKRPAIKSLNMEEIRDKILKMLSLREPIYDKAHLVFDRSKDVEADANQLSTYLKMFI